MTKNYYIIHQAPPNEQVSHQLQRTQIHVSEIKNNELSEKYKKILNEEKYSKTKLRYCNGKKQHTFFEKKVPLVNASCACRVKKVLDSLRKIFKEKISTNICRTMQKQDDESTEEDFAQKKRKTSEQHINGSLVHVSAIYSSRSLREISITLL